MAQSTRRLMMGAAGASGEKTYIDNVFSTYVYKGNNGNHTITNGIDNTEGGLLWTKARTVGESHTLFDTVRASNKAIYTNLAERDETRNFNLNFLSNGFSWNTSDGMVNNASHNYAAWNFRKKEGFFDIVTWTGNGSAPRSISHNLGSVPGLIMVKCTSSNSTDWMVWHRDFDAKDYITLNSTSAKGTNEAKFGGQASGAAKPTSTTFALGASNDVNGNGNTYIAYLFAGGASDEPGAARSVEFDGSNDYLSIADNDDFNLGTGDYTIEGWFKCDDGAQMLFSLGDTNSSPKAYTDLYTDGSFNTYVAWDGSAKILSGDGGLQKGQWQHVAVVRNSGTVTMYINGISQGTASQSTYSVGSGSDGFLNIGAGSYNNNPGSFFDGKISNFRIVKGTAVYTESFRPPTQGLTNITNTKLLCCNKNTVTGSTVTPGTITSNGSPQSSTSTPFDDPNGFKFGEGGDQNIIKTGSYTGTGNSGDEVYVGFEPQLIMFKNASASYNWYILDVMRGIVADGDDKILAPNTSSVEWDSSYIDVTPTGFKLQTSHPLGNASGNTYIYMCLRRPDGYVGKPAEAGTNTFAMDTGAGTSTMPNFDSGFPLDWAITRAPASSTSWETGGRLIQGKWIATNSTGAESPAAYFSFDSNTGWMSGASAYNSDYQSWMFKRGNGFDVRTYKGNNTAGSVWAHNLNAVPEMIWIKNRGATADWAVGHKGLNGGTNPWNYRLNLNNSAAQSSANDYWGGSSNTGLPPTSTHFFLGSSWTESNANNNNYIAMLFASVAGISKVGSYTGSSYDVTINLGFTPRFLMVKAYNTSSGNQRWTVFDSLRGMGVGSNDKRMYLDDSQAQQTGDYITSVSSTGITMKTNYSYTNSNGYQYIYYAHA
jgi:hypothetical protein